MSEPQLCIDCLKPATVLVEQPGYWPAPIGLCDECWAGYQQMGERVKQMCEDAIAALERQFFSAKDLAV